MEKFNIRIRDEVIQAVVADADAAKFAVLLESTTRVVAYTCERHFSLPKYEMSLFRKEHEELLAQAIENINYTYGMVHTALIQPMFDDLCTWIMCQEDYYKHRWGLELITPDMHIKLVNDNSIDIAANKPVLQLGKVRISFEKEGLCVNYM